jgi:hypothetical protein
MLRAVDVLKADAAVGKYKGRETNFISNTPIYTARGRAVAGHIWKK